MKVQHAEQAILVELAGRLIYDNLELTQQELQRLLESGPKDIFLKMDELKYLDSSALGMLLDLNNNARSSGRTLTMVGPPSHIRDIFHSTRLDNIFRIVIEEEAKKVTARFGDN
jgi:anti-sigma B factor antagonist